MLCFFSFSFFFYHPILDQHVKTRGKKEIGKCITVSIRFTIRLFGFIRSLLHFSFTFFFFAQTPLSPNQIHKKNTPRGMLLLSR